MVVREETIFSRQAMNVQEVIDMLSKYPKDMDVTTMVMVGSEIYLKDIVRSEELNGVKDGAIRKLDKRGKKVVVLR